MRITLTIRFMAALAALLMALATIGRADKPRTDAISVAQQHPVSFVLEKPGNVSVAIYDQRGIQVRTLRHAEPLAAGKHEIVWDGLDRNGQPVAAGEYHWKLLQTQGLTAEFLMNLGTSTIEHWPANHGGPTASAVVGDQLVMTAGNSESPIATVCLELATGKRLANSGNVSAWHAITDMAFDDSPLSLPEISLPDGHFYTTVPEDGFVHLARPDGSTATGGGVYWRKKYQFPTHWMPLMRLDFTDGKASAQPGWKAALPEVYSKERGFGWEDVAGITAFATAGDGDQSGHVIIPTETTGSRLRTFLVDVPVGGWQRYEVTFHLGHPDKALPEFSVYGGTSYDNPALKGTVSTKAGEVTTVTYTVMPLPGTQLRLAFGPSKGDYAGCAIRGIEITTGPDRVDAHKGKVIIASTLSGAVREISTDAFKTLASYPVPGVRDVALLADGTILALRDDSIVKVDSDRLTPVMTGLTAATRLSVDRRLGELFVVESGTSSQIKRFDADYKLKATYGRQGGRRQGLYEPHDFLEVSSLAPDGTGGFVITEALSAPRRTAHFDRDGKLIKEWYGGQLWATNAAVGPQDDSRLWFNSHWGWLIEAEVDWKNRTWKPRSTYKFQGLANELVGGASGARGFFDVTYRDGKKHLAGTGMSPCLLRVDEAQQRLTPVMTSGINITHYWTSQSPFLQKLLGSRQSKFKSYVWQDANGDGEPQEGEVRFSEWSNWGPGWTVSPASAFAGIFAQHQPEITAHLLASGADGYPSFDKATRLMLATDRSLRDADKHLQPRDVWRDASGNWYSMLEGSGDGFLATSTYAPGHATAWPGNLSGSAAVAKWDAAGQLVWKVGSKAASMDNQLRGQLHAPVRVLGEVSGCIGVADRIVQPAEFWTTDGLYVGGLFDHRANDGLGANYYSWWQADRKLWPSKTENESPIDYDMVTGGMLFQRRNGDVIYCADGWNNLPTYRITGWDKFVRQQGSLRVTASSKPAAETGTGLAARYEPSKRETVAPQIWFGDEPRKKRWPDSIGNEFTASWSGRIEPRFSESYFLHLYVGKDAKNLPEEARLWIDGRLVIDTTKNAKANVTRFRTDPLPLTASKPVPIKLEYKKTGSGELHLSWESLSQSIEHIPTSALYAD